MNKRLMKRLERYKDIAKALEDLPANASVPPAFPAKVEEFRSRIAAINQLAYRQSLPTSIATNQTRAVFDDMIESALYLAGVIGIVARDLQRPQLAEQVRLTRDAFVRLRAPNRTIPASRIADAARSVAAHLAPYGVTEATLAEFEAKIEAARRAAVQPRMAMIARSAATSELDRLFADTDDLLTTTIDCLVRPLRKQHPSFNHAYHIARTTPLRPRPRKKKRAGASPHPAPAEPSTIEVPV